MRVTTGRAKGRALKSVPGDTTRPVTGKVKQAVFNILGDDVLDSTWLDLFAGTGAVGIEALSRGARSVTFIEKDALAVRTIQHNLKTTQLEDRSRVVRQDAFRFIAAYPNTSFDIIYVAPPQYQGLWAEALTAIDNAPNWLNAEGVVIAQINPREYHELALRRLEVVDQRRYGSSMLCFYERKQVEPPVNDR